MRLVWKIHEWNTVDAACCGMKMASSKIPIGSEKMTTLVNVPYASSNKHARKVRQTNLDKPPPVWVCLTGQCCGQVSRPSTGLCLIAFAVPLVVPGLTLTIVAFEEGNGFPKYSALHVLGMVLLVAALGLIVSGLVLSAKFKSMRAQDQNQLMVATPDQNHRTPSVCESRRHNTCTNTGCVYKLSWDSLHSVVVDDDANTCDDPKICHDANTSYDSKALHDLTTCHDSNFCLDSNTCSVSNTCHDFNTCQDCNTRHNTATFPDLNTRFDFNLESNENVRPRVANLDLNTGNNRPLAPLSISQELCPQPSSSNRSCAGYSSSFDSVDSEEFSSGSYILSENLDTDRSILSQTEDADQIHPSYDNIVIHSIPDSNPSLPLLTFKPAMPSAPKFTFSELPSFVHSVNTDQSQTSLQSQGYRVSFTGKCEAFQFPCIDEHSQPIKDINQRMTPSESNEFPPPTSRSPQGNSPGARQRLPGLSPDLLAMSPDSHLLTHALLADTQNVTALDSNVDSSSSVFSVESGDKMSTEKLSYGGLEEKNLTLAGRVLCPPTSWTVPPRTASRPNSFPVELRASDSPDRLIRINSLNDKRTLR